jgi:hypothetical protein
MDGRFYAFTFVSMDTQEDSMLHQECIEGFDLRKHFWDVFIFDGGNMEKNLRR